MVIIEVMYGEPGNTNIQTKKFKDVGSCIEWCRRHYKNIDRINDLRTYFQQISHYEIIDAIRGVYYFYTPLIFFGIFTTSIMKP